MCGGPLQQPAHTPGAKPATHGYNDSRHGRRRATWPDEFSWERFSGMSRLQLIAAATLAVACTTAPCQAQIVRWGPFGGVSVRAPFVSVDVSPFGATRVRAPFTSVYSSRPVVPYGPAVVGVPAFPYGVIRPYAILPPLPPYAVVPAVPAYSVPVYPSPAYPTPGYPEVVYAEPDISAQGYQVTRPALDGHLSEDLRRAAMRLQSSLSVRHDGDTWLGYLNPGRIITSIDAGEPPSSLRDMIRNFDGVVANRSLHAIYTTSGFNETRELLRVYVDLPPQQPSVSPDVVSPDVVSPDGAVPSAAVAEDLPPPSPVPAPPEPNPPVAVASEPTDL